MNYRGGQVREEWEVADEQNRLSTRRPKREEERQGEGFAIRLVKDIMLDVIWVQKFCCTVGLIDVIRDPSQEASTVACLLSPERDNFI